MVKRDSLTTDALWSTLAESTSFAASQPGGSDSGLCFVGVVENG